MWASLTVIGPMSLRLDCNHKPVPDRPSTRASLTAFARLRRRRESRVSMRIECHEHTEADYATALFKGGLAR